MQSFPKYYWYFHNPNTFGKNIFIFRSDYSHAVPFKMYVGFRAFKSPVGERIELTVIFIFLGQTYKMAKFKSWASRFQRWPRIETRLDQSKFSRQNMRAANRAPSCQWSQTPRAKLSPNSTNQLQKQEWGGKNIAGQFFFAAKQLHISNCLAEKNEPFSCFVSSSLPRGFRLATPPNWAVARCVARRCDRFSKVGYSARRFQHSRLHQDRLTCASALSKNA